MAHTSGNNDGTGNGKNPNNPSPTTKIIDGTSPFFLHPSDNPGSMISSCVLKGDNYDLWQKAIRNALRAKNKLDFVDGTIAKLEPTVPEVSLWGSCNSMLVSWLFNSIDPALQPSIAYVETVKELWDDLQEHFSIGNGTRIHQLKTDIAGAKQQGQSVVGYFTRLKGMWDELNNYSRISMCTCKGCTCNMAGALVREREDEKIHQFLMGLDDSVFGIVRSTILSMEPLPNLNKVYSMVIQEERHRSLAQAKEDRNDAVGFAVQAGKLQMDRKQGKGGSGDRPVCAHCGKSGHEKVQCYELIGYPEGWTRGGRGGQGGRGGGRGGRGRGQAYANAVHGASNTTNGPDSHKQESQVLILGLSDVQVQQIMAIVANSHGAGIGAPHGAGASHGAGAPNDKLHGKQKWILDSGASYHMTGDYSCLGDICEVNPIMVGLPNGEQTVATLEGNVVLNKGLVLQRVLYVPSLNCNLISIGQLINNSNCFVTFTNELCFIQDRNLRMPIGVGEQRDGVYYYHPITSAQVCHANGRSLYELWHKRMGHPSRHITLSLVGISNNIADSESFCEICVRAKQTREIFYDSLNKATESFELIHCDIWVHIVLVLTVVHITF